MFRKKDTKTKQASTLRQLSWGLPFLGTFLPIVLLTLYSLEIATNSVQKLIEAENLSTTSNLSQLINRDFTQSVSLLHAMSAISGTVNAVEESDVYTMTTRLKAIVVSYPQVDRAFITSTGGVLWAEYPSNNALRQNFSQHEWYRGVTQQWTTYISGVYHRSASDYTAVVAIANPVFNKEHKPIGLLVFEFQLKQFEQWLTNTQVSRGGFSFILDHNGNIVAHHEVRNDILNDKYKNLEPVRQALDGLFHTREYIDPLRNTKMIATFMPVAVGSNKWVIVAQQPKDQAFAMIKKVAINLSTAGGILAIFTLFMVIALARLTAKNVRLNNELEFKNQALKDFTSIVSHQLKAPITALRWKIEGMLDGDYGTLQPELKAELEDMDKVNKSNYHLVLDILNVSRLDRGVVEVKTETVALIDIVNRAIRDYKIAAEKAGLYVKIVGEDLGIMVEADIEKSAEAITNALSNSIKYTQNGGITITLLEHNGMAQVEVSDTGMGMSADMIEKLFSRDGIRKSNTGAESSSGLGLFIAREFMRNQGGDIMASSEEGKGSTFTYTWKLSV